MLDYIAPTARGLEMCARSKFKCVLMNLWKTFDYLPHGILLCKLSAYRLTSKSVKLLGNYLSCRSQHIKSNGVLSTWCGIKKGYHKGLYLALFCSMLLLIIFSISSTEECSIIALTTKHYPSAMQISTSLYLFYRKRIVCGVTHTLVAVWKSLFSLTALWILCPFAILTR
jgi:hypothetical protein